MTLFWHDYLVSSFGNCADDTPTKMHRTKRKKKARRVRGLFCFEWTGCANF